MQLEHCKDQTSQTLEKFYEAGRDSPGATMLALIARLRALPDDRRVWGLTSHYHLCLLAENTYQSPWYVRFVGTHEHAIFVEYLMPEDEAPWPGAYVTGVATSLDEAVRMILVGMEKSRGWPSSMLEHSGRASRPSDTD